jgi:hypothetical protein
LYLCQETWAVTIEITKPVEIPKVTVSVAIFVPLGLIPCASRPLVDAALYLITMDTTCQHQGEGTWLACMLTTVSERAMTSNGMGVKYSSKTIPSSSLLSNHMTLMTRWRMGCRYGYRGRPPKFESC